MLNLEPIKARHAATTPGLWAYTNNQGEPPDGGWNVFVPSRDTVTRQATRADAEFIAAAHLEVPCLVAEVESLRAELLNLAGLNVEHLAALRYLATLAGITVEDACRMAKEDPPRAWKGPTPIPGRPGDVYL